MPSFHFPPPPQPITVVVASQHAVVEAGICICLSRVPYLEVLGSATDGPSLEQQLHRLKPNVVLSEIDLPELDGIAAMELIWRQFPATSLIGHSWTQVSPDQVTALMNAGAMGFVQEPVQSAEIAQVILKVHYGHLAFTTGVLKNCFSNKKVARPRPGFMKALARLTAQETQTACLICEELCNKEIADRMNLSVKSIERTRQRAMEKMEVRNAVGIVKFCIRYGLYTLED